MSRCFVGNLAARISTQPSSSAKCFKASAGSCQAAHTPKHREMQLSTLKHGILSSSLYFLGEWAGPPEKGGSLVGGWP